MISHLIPEGGCLTPVHQVYIFSIYLEERGFNGIDLKARAKTCIGGQKDAECNEDEG